MSDNVRALVGALVVWFYVVSLCDWALSRAVSNILHYGGVWYWVPAFAGGFLMWVWIVAPSFKRLDAQR
jgi:hypothetical protein